MINNNTYFYIYILYNDENLKIENTNTNHR